VISQGAFLLSAGTSRPRRYCDHSRHGSIRHLPRRQPERSGGRQRKNLRRDQRSGPRRTGGRRQAARAGPPDGCAEEQYPIGRCAFSVDFVVLVAECALDQESVGSTLGWSLDMTGRPGDRVRIVGQARGRWVVSGVRACITGPPKSIIPDYRPANRNSTPSGSYCLVLVLDSHDCECETACHGEGLPK
jgi:hypothetical protein